jgi:hypothetical protein
MALIQGVVVDPQARPVPEAAVYFVAAPANMPDVALLSDGEGRFVLAAPVPGVYTLAARAEPWGVAQASTEIRGDEPVTLTIQFAPKPTSSWAEEEP